MIVASGIAMQFGAKPLFSDVSVKFGGGNRHGLIGANGCGKSTFMKILGGELEPGAGTVAIDANERVGRLRQDQFAYEGERVLDVVLRGHAEMWAAMRERDAIYADPEAGETEFLRAAELEAKYAEYGGYTASARAAELLLGLGVPTAQHDGHHLARPALPLRRLHAHGGRGLRRHSRLGNKRNFRPGWASHTRSRVARSGGMAEEPHPDERLDPLILSIRGRRVILDANLARLYGVTTRRFNEAFRRNRDRFPDDFAFQLTGAEFADLRLRTATAGLQHDDLHDKSTNRSQIATGSQKHRDPRFRPWVLSEHGALMAANLLRSKRAVHMSVFVIRAFVRLREEVAANSAILKRLAEIDATLLGHDTALRDVYRRLLPLLQPPPEPPKRSIGFHTNGE